MRNATELEAMDVQSCWRVLMRRKRVVLAPVVGFAMLGLCLNAFTPPVYRAQVRIEIRRPWDQGSLPSTNFQSENVSMYTAAALITSRTLLGQLAREFDGRGWIHAEGAEDPDRRGLAGLRRWARRTAAGWSGRPPGIAPLRGAADPFHLSAQIDWLQTIISVEPLRDTRLVDIKVEHTRPEAARTIADRLARRFVEYRSRRAAGADTSRPSDRQDENAEVRNVALAPESPVSGAKAASRTRLRARVRHLDGEIATVNREYFKTKADRMEAAARLARLERFVADSAADWSQLPIEGGAMDALRRDLLSWQVRLAATREVYKEKHPKIAVLESELAAVHNNIRRELRRSIAAQRAELTALAMREADLRASLAQSEWEMGQAEEQAEERAGGHTFGPTDPAVPSVVIVDPATVEPRPVRPRKALNIVMCLAAGLLVGVGLALLGHSLRDTIQAPEDVEEQLELPLLGVIPKKPWPAMA